TTRPATSGVTGTWRYAFGSTVPGRRSSSAKGSVATAATTIPTRSLPSFVSGTTTSPSGAPAAEGVRAPGGTIGAVDTWADAEADGARAGDSILRITNQVPPAPATSTRNT